MDDRILTASFPFWADTAAVLAAFYLFLVGLKQAVKYKKELRGIFLLIALVVIPLLLIVHFAGRWRIGADSGFDDFSHWWVVPIQPKGGDAAPHPFNLVTCGLILSLLYIITTLFLGLFSWYYRVRKEGHVMALHKALIKLAIMLAGLIIYLKAHQIDLTPIWVGMGAASIILGIALRDPLSSFFTGLALDVEGVLKRGDWIQVGGEDGLVGRVVEKNWRTTKLMTIEDELVTIPNQTLGSETIINFHQPDSLHVQRLQVGTSYNDPPIKVKEVLRNILMREEHIARDPPPSVRTIRYNDFSIDYELRFSIGDYGKRQRIKDSVMTQIWYAFKFYGIEIPFPIRTVHMKEQAHLADDRKAIQQGTADTKVFLMGLPFLAPHLQYKDFEFLALNAFERFYNPGEHVIHRGEMGDALYIVREGSGEVVLPGGERRRIDPVGYFGEMGLLKTMRRTADVLAGPEGCRTVRIDRECMQVLFKKYPHLREEFEEVRERRLEDAGLGEKARAEDPASWPGKMLEFLKGLVVPW